MKKEIGLLNFKSRQFKQKLDQARSIIDQAFNTVTFDKWYIALSGGKDSTVVFDLIRRIYPEALCFWSDEEFYLPETGQYIERLRQAGVNIRQCRGEIKHTDWFTSNKDSEKMGKTALAKSIGIQGVFMGLRADENRYRRVFLKKYGLLYFVQNKEIWYCNPIAWWTVYDVWAYIYGQRIDYNRAYDVLDKIGVKISNQRIGPYATEKALGYGQLSILKLGWPQEFERFAEKFPQATGYI